MNFVHNFHQRVQLQTDNGNKNLLCKLIIKFKQVRLLDNVLGCRMPVVREHELQDEIN